MIQDYIQDTCGSALVNHTYRANLTVDARKGTCYMDLTGSVPLPGGTFEPGFLSQGSIVGNKILSNGYVLLMKSVAKGQLFYKIPLKLCKNVLMIRKWSSAKGMFSTIFP